jgi:hypothetical protein
MLSLLISAGMFQVVLYFAAARGLLEQHIRSKRSCCYVAAQTPLCATTHEPRQYSAGISCEFLWGLSC